MVKVQRGLARPWLYQGQCPGRSTRLPGAWQVAPTASMMKWTPPPT